MSGVLSAITRVCAKTARQTVTNPTRWNSSLRLTFAVQRRINYPRMYKTKVVQSDGSIVTIRCREPKKVLKFPVDVTKMSQAQKTEVWLSRKGSKQGVEEMAVETDFDVQDYSKYWTK